MKTGTFIAEVDARGKIALPVEITTRLELSEGDKVEILLKKIRIKRLEVKIGKNPLYKLLQLSDNK
jgi:bifunctional DNA-binding transcriptional regulator/antitoxin component of YhaV-PrlF toxin-antitoxin module